MKGSTMDRVVAQYRKLTGQSPMMPRYIFGYIQSKERYTHSKELVDVVQEYRRRQVPLDVIVQDWNSWPGGQWGSMKMNRENYPDPRTLADSIHAWDAKLMVSIWPNPTNCPQTKDFERRGFMLPRSVYDAFNPWPGRAIGNMPTGNSSATVSMLGGATARNRWMRIGDRCPKDTVGTAMKNGGKGIWLCWTVCWGLSGAAFSRCIIPRGCTKTSVPRPTASEW